MVGVIVAGVGCICHEELVVAAGAGLAMATAAKALRLLLPGHHRWLIEGIGIGSDNNDGGLTIASGVAHGERRIGSVEVMDVQNQGRRCLLMVECAV